MIRQQLKQYFIFFEPLMRFELMTSSLPRKRSTPELQRQNNMSGKRDSNSRPSAWKADALSTELFPQNTQTLQHLRELIHCGESRIRTYEDESQRSYSPPQLATLVSPQFLFNTLRSFLSRWRDSNPRPADYKSAALASLATSAFNGCKLI